MKSNGKDTYLKFGNNHDVVEKVVLCYEKWRDQPADLVAQLRELSPEEQCYAIFRYVIDNVHYKVDKPGYQYIKSPARLLDDAEGDCKSMTLFIASCLHCLGISHVIRFVNFDGGSQYTHVYPIAVMPTGDIIILDAVERDAQQKPVYNYARDYRKKLEIYYKE